MRTASLDVRASASLHAFPRVGVIVPKYRHTSVARNRVKRRLRELVRLHMLPLLQAHAQAHAPVDLVIRVFPAAYRHDAHDLAAELGQAVPQLLRRLA